MRIYMVRHGETLWNKEGKYYGFTDVGLSESGILQAENLGTYFKKKKFDRVIVSPLKRAEDTAERLTDQELSFETRLMEQNFGLFEGKTYGELMKEYPEEMNEWNQDFEHYRVPEGESFGMVRKRIEEFAEALWDFKEDQILIVAHKGTLGHLIAALLNMPLEGYWNFVLEQGTYCRVDLEDGYAIVRKLNADPVQLLKER